MTKTDAWRRLAVETPEGATLLFDPSEVFYLEVDGHCFWGVLLDQTVIL